jgi:hypothetical protein
MVDNSIALQLHKVATPAIFHLQYMSSHALFIGWSRNVSFINLDLPKPHLPIFGNHCQKSNDLKFRQRLCAALRCRRRA